MVRADNRSATNGAPPPPEGGEAGSSKASTVRDTQPKAISDTFLTDADFATLPADGGLLLQFTALLYYLQVMNPDNGLVREKTEPNTPASIAAIGMALASSPVVVERGVVTRQFAAKIARRQLRYLMELPQGPEPDASGYKGFFYHFPDIETGRQVWQCELSTIDSTFLSAGALTVATYFDRDTAEEAEVRRLANQLYERADWNWACNGEPTLTHGWTPEKGFIPHRWRGYDEGLLLYFLGLGSPTHPLEPESYAAYAATDEWKSIYGRENSIQARFSPISYRICGSTFGGSATSSCAGVTATISRTADKRPLCSRSTRSAQSNELRRLRTILLGLHGVRRAWLDNAEGQWRRAAVLRLHRPRCSVWP